jgi:invasion protein IalB
MAWFRTTAEVPGCPAKRRGGKGAGDRGTLSPRAWSDPIESEHAPDSLVWSHFLRRTGAHFVGKCSSAVLGVFLLAALLNCLPAIAQTGTGTAQPPAAPAAGQTQTFRSWALDCLVPKTGPGAGKRACFIHYEAHDKTDPKQITARAVIRYGGNPRKLTLIFELPPNTTQASGISLTVDLGKPVNMPIQACMPKFCYGATDLSPDLETEAKAGQQLVLGFTAKDKGPQQVPVPLYGITAALDALNKTGS